MSDRLSPWNVEAWRGAAAGRHSRARGKPTDPWSLYEELPHNLTTLPLTSKQLNEQRYYFHQRMTPHMKHILNTEVCSSAMEIPADWMSAPSSGNARHVILRESSSTRVFSAMTMTVQWGGSEYLKKSLFGICNEFLMWLVHLSSFVPPLEGDI